MTDENVVKKSARQELAEKRARKNERYYSGYPIIRGTQCEYTGLHISKSPFYREIWEKTGGQIIALDGSRIGDPAIQHVKFMYVPHRGFFIADTSRCEEIYKQRFGGYEPKVSYFFYLRDVPWHGAVLPEVASARKGISAILKEVEELPVDENLI